MTKRDKKQEDYLFIYWLDWIGLVGIGWDWDWISEDKKPTAVS